MNISCGKIIHNAKSITRIIPITNHNIQVIPLGILKKKQRKKDCTKHCKSTITSRVTLKFVQYLEHVDSN